jgi:hypothetical protein
MTEITQQTPPPEERDGPPDAPRPRDPKAPVPFVPDVDDAPRDPDTGDVAIDEPELTEPGAGR